MDKKIQVIYKKVDDLVPYENNPRNNDEAVEAVANSIKEFGFGSPIVIDEKGEIINGHTRLKSAKLIGLNEVPTVTIDWLTEEQKKAYRLADNKTGELADWDLIKLNEELEGLNIEEMEKYGFEFETFVEEIEEKEEKPEVKFTEELNEESNYIVLKFDTMVDWLQLESLYNLPRAKALHSKEGFEAIGIGRVIDGKEFLNKIQSGLDEVNWHED